MHDVVRPDCAYFLPITTFIGDECFQAGENDEELTGSDLVVFVEFI